MEHDPDRQQDRVVLAEQGPAPGQADPQPGRGPAGGREGDRQAVERQEPEEQQRPFRLGGGPDHEAVIAGRVQREGGEDPGPWTIEP